MSAIRPTAAVLPRNTPQRPALASQARALPRQGLALRRPPLIRTGLLPRGRRKPACPTAQRGTPGPPPPGALHINYTLASIFEPCVGCATFADERLSEWLRLGARRKSADSVVGSQNGHGAPHRKTSPIARSPGKCTAWPPRKCCAYR